MKQLFTKMFVALVAVTIAFAAQAQSTISVRINSASDDLEEWLPGANQTKVAGVLDDGSSDLEFGNESGTNDPQMVGLRFTNITIPKGSLITRAYIQFTVDAISKNSDPCTVYIKAENSDNPTTFLSTDTSHLSKRKKLVDSITWNVSPMNTWSVVGSAGVNQRSADIKSLVQSLVNLGGWNSGNAMAFYLTGNGTREVESFDGDAPKAPLLVIEYVAASTVTSRINNIDDDLEEWLPGANQTKVAGVIDGGSSDLEFGNESITGDPQMVGLRFTNMQIPKGSLISKAYIQFTVDATNKNTDPCSVVIRAENNDNPLTFIPTDTAHLSKRAKSADSVVWNVSPLNTWSVVGAASENQRSADIKTLVQSLVNRSGWISGNAMAFYMRGNGTREVESFDGDAPKAPQLVVEFIPVTTVATRVNSVTDDLEEFLPGANQSKAVGTLDDGSSDLEIGNEAAAGDPQMVGIRFTNLAVPKGAQIQKAYIQFTVDATGKNTDPCVATIRYENNDNPNTFNPADTFNLTKRLKSADSLVWSVSPLSTWSVVGAAGENQRTPDLKNMVQTIVNRDGWAAGNAMAFYITGTGTREVESFDGDAPKAPQLVIEYLGGSSGGGGSYVPNPIGVFPVEKKSRWNYWDKGNKPALVWRDTLNNDTLWPHNLAPLGYGDDLYSSPKLSFGTDSANKFVTAYFRRMINIPSTAALSNDLELNLMADDGAIVYINGTEVLRHNLPTGGVIDSNTLATKNIEGQTEKVFFSYDIPKTAFRNGLNTIAVEVHQFNRTNSDLGFDFELKNRSMIVNAPATTCNGANDPHISCFTSLMPIEKIDTVGIPATHGFQVLHSEGDIYTKGGGTVPGAHDFTGYVAKSGSSKNGYLSVNHETGPAGGVSMVDISFDCNTGFWKVDSSQAINFGGELVRTERNCSGGVTPWGTIVTCEETLTSGDLNADGYQDVGWNVEIDPVSKSVPRYGTSLRQKLWAMGRISHENACFKNDSLTSYYGEDDGTGNLFKFVAAQKTNMYTGTLYVLKLDSGLLNNEPRANKGVWVVVPNTSITDRNNTKALAAGLGGTFFNGIEDAEIHPISGQIYFTAKGNSRTYRFTDNNTSVTNFETFVGGRDYRINSVGGVVSEPWGSGNDNLTFDSRGNLYVLQDGGRDHVWLVRNDHTQANPKVEVFMTTPSGSEPTGMTFSPDERFMFISIQSPSINGIQKDIKGDTYNWTRNRAIVVGRRESFSRGTKAGFTVNDATQCLNGNSFALADTSTGSTRTWAFGNGQTSTNSSANISFANAGTYNVTLTKTTANGCADTARRTVNVYAKPALVAVLGNTTADQGSTQPYSVTNNTGSSYQWWIDNGTQATGTTTNAITVAWSSSAANGAVRVQETDANTCKGDTALLNVALKTVSLADINKIAGVTMYPNPVSTEMTIDSKHDLTYTIIDLAGKTVATGTVKANQISTINVEQLAAGAYHIQLTTADKSAISTFIKK